MKVMILSANREHFPEPVFPLGTAFLASCLAGKGAETAVFDAGAYRFPLAHLRRKIRRFRPDVIAISLRNVDNAAYPCTTMYLPWYRSLVREVRSLSPAAVVLGGSAFSIFPNELLDFLEADTGYTGDGEAAVPLLLDRRWRRGEFSDLRLESLESVGMRADSIDLFPSRRHYRTIGVQTARGCPNRCIYCTYPLLEGKRLRTRTPAQVADEIALVRKTWGVREFFIVDSSFNASEEHMAGVLEEILLRRLDIRFTCYLQPTVSDPDLFRLLAAAGCVAVEFGTDSASPAVLEALGKRFAVSDIVNSSDLCRRAGIDFCHSLLFGGPGENDKTVDETVRLIQQTAPRAVIAMTGLRIYPGTALEALALREGVIPPGFSLFRPAFYFAGKDPERGSRHVFEKAGLGKTWFFPGRKNWSASLWPRLLRLFHRRGPMWFRLQGRSEVGRDHREEGSFG
jgi:radical SAM superfamily enzyme YgiQ (UPF0313 family)